MFGPAANCTKCKLLSSQIFFNNKKERVCAGCIQIEHDDLFMALEKFIDESNSAAKKNKELEQKVTLYDAIIEQIKNFTHLVRKE